MIRFMSNDPGQFEWLKAAIQGKLYTYDDVQLPPTCTPSSTRMGFEYTPKGGYAIYVEKGIKYVGFNSEFRGLLADGEKRFASYDDMMSFIKRLKPLFYNHTNDATRPSGAAVLDAPFEIQQRQNRDLNKLYDRSKIIAKSPEAVQIFLDSDEIYNELVKKIKGQDDCIRQLADVTTVHLAQVEPKRPATIFMAGPTGTGKTESAITLVDAINTICQRHNKYKYQMIRINCNQYKEAHRVAQLLGSPNGYVGYGDPPVIAPLARNPRTIILFDEIEKAHNDVLDTIMNAMDTGIIQIPSPINGSNEIDCKHSIFIFTSNLSVCGQGRAVGFISSFAEDGDIDTDEACKKALVGHGIKPEFAGRILSFLIFKPLEIDVIADVIALAIVDCANSFGLCIRHIDSQIIQCILDKNHTSFGVRTYKQDIQKKLGKVFVNASKIYRGQEISIRGGLDDISVEAVQGSS